MTATSRPERQPEPSWSLRRFGIWWWRHKPYRAPPPAAGIHPVGDFLGVTLFREAPFQVQQFIGYGGAVVSPHAHPNFDSLEVWVCAHGTGSFKSERNAEWRGMLELQAGELHSGNLGPHGGCFVSIQKWRIGVEPISGELDWSGEPMNLAHLFKLARTRNP